MNRNIVMDAVRGLAVLGLLSMNLIHMANFEYGYVPDAPKNYLDPLFATVNTLFFDGRFRSLFAMLFGAALLIQLKKYPNHNHVVVRLRWLMVIGILHGALIWPGDILFSYALSGFFVLHFVHNNISKLKRYATIFIVAPALLLTLLNIIEPNTEINRQSPEFTAFLQQLPENYWALLEMNALYFIIMSLLIPFITLWNTAGLMLLGMIIYRRGWLSLERQEPIHKIMLFTITALIVALLGFVIEKKVASDFFAGLNWLCAVPVSLFYLVIIKSLIRAGISKLQGLQKVGRMALTWYLLHSIVFVSFFMFIQPEAVSHYNRIDYFAIFVGAAIIQVLLSLAYFRVFQQGPFEYLLQKAIIKSAKTND
ncbi:MULTISPECIES: DUF418 domain-containing protein [unclassified Pseudoalteromonas]|uniref:DUF418 domain-containing protein n=1 Tax=unclassified Pseudoalteromonas TaxID=194690 RepID=UPI003014510A